MRLLIRWLALAVAFWVSAAVVPGISITGGVASYFWIALIFGLVNAVLGTLMRIVTFPLTILTFGLFLLVVNTLMLMTTDKITDKLSIDGFGYAFLGALIISVVSSLLASTIGKVAN